MAVSLVRILFFLRAGPGDFLGVRIIGRIGFGANGGFFMGGGGLGVGSRG